MSKHIIPKQIYYTCDICDKKYTKNNKGALYKINLKEYRKTIWYEDTKKLDYMLCENCFNKMERYIKKNVIDKRQEKGIRYEQV